MPVFTIANAKGGVGKSTLSVNLAGYFASRGIAVMLGDVDSLQASRRWLSIRPPSLPRIHSWEMSPTLVARPPKGVTHAVLDTPAGLVGMKLSQVLSVSNKVLVPLSGSTFDLYATLQFIEELRERSRHLRPLDVALVGMRVPRRSPAFAEVEAQAAKLGIPIVARIRHSVVYPNLCGKGLTVWDMPAETMQRDLDEWQGIVEWLERPLSSESPALAQARPGDKLVTKALQPSETPAGPVRPFMQRVADALATKPIAIPAWVARQPEPASAAA